jgi:hypothetical protein
MARIPARASWHLDGRLIVNAHRGWLRREQGKCVTAIGRNVDWSLGGYAGSSRLKTAQPVPAAQVIAGAVFSESVAEVCCTFGSGIIAIAMVRAGC